MNKFLRLSTRLINPQHIEQIVISADKYIIHMANREIGGWFALGSGGIDTNENYIKVCKDKNPVDYDTVRQFINNQTPEPKPRDIET